MTYDLPTAVEASSLSAVTEQAANPPSSLHTASTHGTQQPLILYIARVPGSRDVFLTPLKPREKVVTAQDVQSSLYYLHMNAVTDYELLKPSAANSANTEAGSFPSLQASGLQRKPVPPPRPGGSQSSVPPLRGFGGKDQPGVQHKAVLSHKTPSASMKSSQLPQIPQGGRHPLPATPPEESTNDASFHVENIQLLRRSGHNDDSNPYLRKYQVDGASVPSPQASPNLPEQAPSQHDVGSLTLIRRDPAIGAQWNVASILDPLVEEVSSKITLSSVSNRRIKQSGAPLYLDITNPAYLQFIASSQDRSPSRNSTSTSSTGNETVPEGTFRRRLYMPGSKYADHSYNQSLASPLELSGTERERTAPIMDRRSRLYSFLSPWDGRCEFTTSSGGTSLRCRHVLARDAGVADVSELRFNLPSTSHLKAVSTSKAEKRGPHFAAHQRMQSDDSWGGAPSLNLNSVEDGEHFRLDLSLGQERAGGGFGGKQAKLGKLIIYPGGLSMLDLVVAANMGLWWRAWERLA